MDDNDYMGLALAQAEEAFARGDWPVGAVVVNEGRILALGQNRQNTMCDVTVHAETDALRRAQSAHGLPAIAGSTLYCTMEPCPMCAWALKLAGVRRLVLGLRHATLDRVDMGGYSIEAFCTMVGFDTLQLTTDVRIDECLEIRRRWGKDQVRTAPPDAGGTAPR
ncbi:MAG: nucleoside deaminase [Burkholderiales bacterium]|nr:nucleoside deaminase [Burkholderiales bacterium]